ncbi:MAG: aryl-sulfate sulfotransferase [Proteobacteria bacterium]|nr:aryl-sulfate sulfotransferase [Pseudomonadota bacterium]
MRCRETGLLEYDKSRATPGFTIFTPIYRGSETAYLLDMDGKTVHQWTLKGFRSGYGQLLSNGNLLAAVRKDPESPSHREEMRVIREYDWDGETLWQCDAPGQHHDFRRLANGNTAFLGFERFTEASKKRLRGGIEGSEMEDGGVLGDYIHEVDPEGNIVWEWHAQDEMEIENYPIHPLNSREEFSHANALWALDNGDYLVSLRRSSWLFIIDRKTKKIRWEMQNDNWGGQHDCQMLDNGNILFFANGLYVSGQLSSSKVIEMNPETSEEVWRYQGSPPWSFYSPHISGCQRLWSGNTLICEGLWGRIFEVTPKGDIVWEYISPHNGPLQGQATGGIGNWVFRAYRYALDSLEIGGRV